MNCLLIHMFWRDNYLKPVHVLISMSNLFALVLSDVSQSDGKSWDFEITTVFRHVGEYRAKPESFQKT